MYVDVRHDHTNVKDVDYVRQCADIADMADGATGQRLLALKARAGLSLEAIAKGAGYSGRSSVQTFFNPSYDKPLDTAVAAKLSEALAGKGNPPVTRAEVMGLTGIDGLFEAEPNVVLPPRYLDLPRDVPAYGTALGTFSDNEMIEQTVINYDDPIDYFIRPPGVANKKGVYGLYVAGESQSPRFKPGELIFVDPNRTPMIGDDVVVYIKQPNGDDDGISAILVKELAKRTHGQIVLRQLNPDVEFSLDSRRVMALHRVLTNADLYSGYR